jgi:EAL domain-containing protein (putative c-di-GMP-specific phosphodiesterase class I)
MSSKPQRFAQTEPPHGTMPYESYAQLVRMLLPLTDKVSFYDEHGQALWISDGLEEPELRARVEAVLARTAQYGSRGMVADHEAAGSDQPTYVFPIRSPGDELVGALAIVFRMAASNAIYRRNETVERLLSPLLEILSHAWHRHSGQAPEDTARDDADASVAGTLETAAPLPALLRRTLANATHRLQCAFGAVVVAERSFTLTHRASPNESDLAINAAIDAVRTPMLKLMQLRSEPFMVNAVSKMSAPYKFLVVPLRTSSDRLAALLLLFRESRGRDFSSADVQAIEPLLHPLSPEMLTELVDGETPAPPRAIEKRASEPGSAAEARTSQVVAQPARPAPLKMNDPARPAGPSVPLVITPDAARPMDERIRAALRDGGLNLYAQRIAPLKDRSSPPRFEVLLRMQEANVLRPPASFFEAAEASTLLPELDRWVIRELLLTLRKHASLVRRSGWEFCINLAAQSLATDRFAEFIVAEVCKSSIPPGLLVFEIAECDALHHAHQVEILSARLRDVGCRLALDNCRSGLATFDPLRKWPVSCVKIDGSLVRGAATNQRTESVLRAVAQLANTMGIETVAERVETADVYEKLVDIGLDYAQGFHFDQPQPLARLFC